ncbi:MAG: integrase/recombinase XerD [Paraglaciecola sp.]|jgi:integrase/recombinase XerD
MFHMKPHRPERQITLKHLAVSGNKMIGIKCYPDKIIQNLIKTLPDVRWSTVYNMAMIPNTAANLTQVFETFKGIAWINCSHFFPNRPVNQGLNELSVDSFRKRTLSPEWRMCPEDFYQALEIKRYSMNTARIYIAMFERFINYYADVFNLMLLGEEAINKYLQHLVQQKKSDSYINQSINAIKFHYEVVLGMPNRFYSIERPFKKESLPKVISKERVLKMIDTCQNIKHKCIVSLLYSSGLRRAELLNLKITDLDSDRMTMVLAQALVNIPLDMGVQMKDSEQTWLHGKNTQ